MTRLVTFVRAIRSSSTLPIVATGENGTTYVVKLRGGAEGILASVTEWIALNLGLLQHSERSNHRLIFDGLKRLRNSAGALERRREEMRNLIPETSEEEQARLERNKRLFQQGFGRL